MAHHLHVHMMYRAVVLRESRHGDVVAPAFLLPAPVLSVLLRRLFFTRLLPLHNLGRFAFVGLLAGSCVADLDLWDCDCRVCPKDACKFGQNARWCLCPGA